MSPFPSQHPLHPPPPVADMDISRRQLHLVSADAARRSGVDGADQEGNLTLSTSLRSPRLSSRSRASGHLEELLLDPEAAAEAGESPAGNGALPPHQPPRGAHNSERARRHWRFAASHVSKLMPDNFANSDSDTASILSERRLARRGGDRSRDAIAQTFISTLAGTLGTGTVLQNQSIAMEHHPGVWSPGSDARCIGLMLVSSYINVLLACIPVGILAGALGWSPTLVFIMVRTLKREWGGRGTGCKEGHSLACHTREGSARCRICTVGPRT